MVELEIHAYNALRVLSEERELSYNQWRIRTKANIETMNKVRRLLLQESLITEKLVGKQDKFYSINQPLAGHQEELVNYILTPYSKITENLIKNTKTIQQKTKSHQRILEFSKNDSKIAKKLWNNQKNFVDEITQSIVEERKIRVVLLSPIIKTPYKKQLERIQKNFYDSVEKYFKALYQMEPMLFVELWQIIFFRISNPKQ